MLLGGGGAFKRKPVRGEMAGIRLILRKNSGESNELIHKAARVLAS